MPPKRKALAVEDGRPTKRSTSVASGMNTPVSMGSSEPELSEVEDLDPAEAENLDAAINKFNLDAFLENIEVGLGHDGVSGLFADGSRDFSGLNLKPDHAQRPVWVDPVDGKIFVETFSPQFQEAQTFLTNVAEPVSRTANMHEYSLNTHSLYGAISVGMTTDDVINQLERLSKTKLSERLIAFIRVTTEAYGKIKLVLKDNRYFLESGEPQVIQKLLQDEQISAARVNQNEVIKERAPVAGEVIIPGTKEAAEAAKAKIAGLNPRAEKPSGPDGATNGQNDEAQMYAALREEDDDDDVADQVHSFEVNAQNVETVQARCLALGLPISEEYDFRNDMRNPNLDIDLRPGTQIRYYQERALTKMFGNGRARSGIIVLPCGAGKTLVGITAACTVKKGVMVLCTSAMSVTQWRNEFIKWSNIDPKDIAEFTSDKKDKFSGSTGIIVTTYSMLAERAKRSYESQQMMDFIQSREWGLMLLDEVHVVPARMFRAVTKSVACHSKLGLTATLLREDDKIKDLNFLIGPKLYEANWQELSDQGHIARVQCAEVWCPMTQEFHSEYIKAQGVPMRTLLYTMNPRKFQACQFLINYHEKRGDKIIVFSDNVFALEHYAKKLNKPYIFGGTGQQERQRLLDNFQHNELVSTIFLSKIGDTSLDLPEATCLIQISSHYGSRRQEAQRLGRILRAKRRNDEGFNAFFYSLVSKDTDEMFYSSRRQAFLVDQGYAFKVITNLQGLGSFPDLAFRTFEERLELLKTVVSAGPQQGEVARGDSDDIYDRKQRRPGQNGKMKGGRNKLMANRQANMLKDLSGGATMAYMESNVNPNKALKKGPQNNFIKTLKRNAQKKAQARKAGEYN